MTNASKLFGSDVRVGQVIGCIQNFQHDDFINCQNLSSIWIEKAQYPDLLKVMETSTLEADYTTPINPAVLSGFWTGNRGATFSDDSTRFAIAQYSEGTAGSNAGMIQIFTIDPETPNSDPALEQTIYNPDYQGATAYFGFSSEISGDGQRLIVGEYYGDNEGTSSTDNSGRFHIYVRNGTAWTLEHTGYAPASEDGNLFGSALCISADGVYAAVGNPSGAAGAEFVQIYKRVGSTWSEYQTIYSDTPSSNVAFGKGLSFSSDGTWLGVLEQNYVYIFKHDGVTYTKHGKGSGGYEDCCIADDQAQLNVNNPAPLMAVCKSSDVSVYWDAGSGSLAQSLITTTVFDQGVKITRDGRYIMFATTDRKLQIYRQNYPTDWDKLSGTIDANGPVNSGRFWGAARGYYTRADNERLPFPVVTGCHTNSASGQTQTYMHRVASTHVRLRIPGFAISAGYYLRVK